MKTVLIKLFVSLSNKSAKLHGEEIKALGWTPKAEKLLQKQKRYSAIVLKLQGHL